MSKSELRAEAARRDEFFFFVTISSFSCSMEDEEQEKIIANLPTGQLCRVHLPLLS